MTEPAAGVLAGATHLFPVRVYFEDTDAGGVVYHANYLKFAERARTEMLRTLGESHAEMVAAGVAVAVRRIEVDFLKPARLDDALVVGSTVAEVKRASFALDQDIARGATTLCRLKVGLACMDLNTGRPTRLPDGARRALDRVID